MEEHTSPGKPLESPLKRETDFQTFFALPANVTADMTDEDWEHEMRKMFQASQSTHLFVQGKISPEDYQDALADLGHNPYELEQFWSEGRTFLG